VLTAATGHRQALLSSCATIDKGPQERKVVSQIFEHAFEISLEAGHPRPRFAVVPIAPRGELAQRRLP
jgi:hypothetical protein